MHEKKDIWKTDGIGIGRGYGIVGLRTEWGKLRYIDSGFKGGDISFIRCGNIVREKTESIDGQTLLQRIAAISGLWIHRWVWIHHLQR